MLQPVATVAATPPLSAPSAPAWGASRRVGFRFVFAFVALWLLPFPLWALPGMRWATRPFGSAWNALTLWAGRAFLHRVVDVGRNGSGDTTAGWLSLALLVALSIVASAVWSVADRRRRHYAQLSRWLHVYLRFGVGTIMIGYGLAKVFHSQFPFPSQFKLEQPYGDASPMGLLWTFMGFSGPYNVFTGLAETVPAVLLYFRRTATLGALMLVAVMSNVVMLNLCYDVPVKILSTELLLASVYIAGPRLRAMFDMLVLGRAVPALPDAPLFTQRRLVVAARLVGVAFAAWVLINETVDIRESARKRAEMNQSSGGIAGAWLVEAETRDGLPLAEDNGMRWQRIGITAYKGVTRAAYRRVDGFYDRIDFKLDAEKKRLTIDPDPGQTAATWTYAQADEDHLTLSGALDGHTRVLTLRRDLRKREYRLVTRGFHWVNEAPYNR